MLESSAVHFVSTVRSRVSSALTQVAISGATGRPSLYFNNWPSEPMTRFRRAGLLAPQFVAPDAAPLYETADGRGWKYSSALNGWAIIREPTGVPFLFRTRLPLA